MISKISKIPRLNWMMLLFKMNMMENYNKISKMNMMENFKMNTMANFNKIKKAYKMNMMVNSNKIN